MADPLNDAFPVTVSTSLAVSLRVIAFVAVIEETPVTTRLVPVASVIAPVEDRMRPPAVLVPVSKVAESSWTFTAPAELNVSEPKLVVPSAPMVIAEPLNAAFPVTVSTSLAVSLRVIAFVAVIVEAPVTTRLVPVASVIAPVEDRVSPPAVLVPVSKVAESSWTFTAPAELTVSEPKLVVPSAPIIMAEPLNDAFPVTVRTSLAVSLSVMAFVAVIVEAPVTTRLVPAASVIAPVEDRVRPPAVLVPVSKVFESSWTSTAPAEVTVSEPKLAAPTGPMVMADPLNDAFPVTVSTSVAVSLRVIAFEIGRAHV